MWYKNNGLAGVRASVLWCFHPLSSTWTPLCVFLSAYCLWLHYWVHLYIVMQLNITVVLVLKLWLVVFLSALYSEVIILSSAQNRQKDIVCMIPPKCN